MLDLELAQILAALAIGVVSMAVTVVGAINDVARFFH